jgi:hypothetical protein
VASFLVVRDRDPGRRARVAAAARERIAPLPGLERGSAEGADAVAVWAAVPGAPVSATAGPDHLAVVWGTALGDGDHGTDAEALRAAWARAAPAPPPAADGFHAAVAIDRAAGLFAGGDVLSLYPIYHWTADDGSVALVGSSPELFAAHPRFRPRLDRQALVGLLLLGHLLDERALLAGVRRLGAGRALVARPGGAPGEVVRWALPEGGAYDTLPDSAHRDIAAEAIDRAIARHLRGVERAALLFSGGLDSRMLAGLARARGVALEALTFGAEHDNDVRCARAVNRVLRMPHRVVPDDGAAFADMVDLCARWEAAGSGLHGAWNWAMPAALHELPRRVLTGVTFDWALGGAAVRDAYAPGQRALSFDAYFADVNARGIPAATLESLLDPALRPLVPEMVATLRARWPPASGRSGTAVWLFSLTRRVPWHPGAMAWRASFGSWPIVPSLDRALLATLAGIPPGRRADRRLQVEIFCARFPELAEVPMDRGGARPVTLRPRLRAQVAQALARRVAWLLPRGATERRRAHRIFGVDREPWLAVRARAEPARERLAALVGRPLVDAVLPPPDRPAAHRDELTDGGGARCLLGLMRWLDGRELA